jgi:thiocyanate desulfurase
MGSSDGVSNNFEFDPGMMHTLKEEILAQARAEAEEILADARSSAEQIRSDASRKRTRRPADVAADQILAKGRAASSEIRSAAADLAGAVRDKAYAEAEAIIARARALAREVRRRTEASGTEILAAVRTAEDELLDKARSMLGDIEASRKRAASDSSGRKLAANQNTAPVRTHTRSAVRLRERLHDRRSMLVMAGGGIAAAVLSQRLIHSHRGGLLSSSAGESSPQGGSTSGSSGVSHVDVSSLRDATVPGAPQLGLGILGDYIYLTPTKLGGGAHAQDLATGKTLAWIEYWNYGDSCPISHHLSAYPSPDPRKGFEFVNSTQGGDNVLIYGLPTDIKTHGLLDPIWGQGNRILRVHYDGQQMNLMEDISETTGIGLGVHIVIFPDATGFAAADGQKDICAFFDRPPIPHLQKDDVAVAEFNKGQKTQVLMAFQADWYGHEPHGSLEANWFKGGKLRITRLIKAKETGLYNYRGVKGNKIDWEMVPMAEYLVYTGQLPGESPRTLCGLDAVVHHPGNRYSAMVIRMCSAAVILDRHSWEPVTCLHNPEGSPGNLPVKKVSSNPDMWDIEFPDIKCVGHEAGFSPDGKFFTMMNNINQNNMAVFDTSDADPRNWKKITFVKDEKWVGNYPSPFHLCFSMDRSKMFVSVLYPKPGKSGTCVVDTSSWKIVKKFENIGPDCQTMSVTYDGKYVLQIFSGFQRLESGVFIYTQDTLEPVGMMPNFGGHHDCVIVPTKVEQLVNSRCTTL